ncbi:MAG: hypothetical protein O3C40_31735 [Planctomycetota bacterium]|nr:hypothetical protein [Planctomycetota bacterium]
MTTEANFEALEKGDDLHHKQLERQVDRTDKQAHTMISSLAELSIQKIAVESARAERVAALRYDSIGANAARTIQQVVASPDFLS